MMYRENRIDPKDIVLREGTVNDLADLIPVVSAMHGVDTDVLRVTGLLSCMQDHLEDVHKTAYICKVRGKMIGVVTVEVCEEEGKTFGYINDIWVSPECRCNGIGRRFVCEAALFCEKEGATEMHLHIKQDDFQTQCFFKQQGYELDSEQDKESGYLLFSEKIPRYFV